MTKHRTPDNWPRDFTDEDLEDFRRYANVPVRQRRKFSNAIRQAVAEYAMDKKTTSSERRDDLRFQIESLARKIREWLEDETPDRLARVKRSLENLDPATFAYLIRFEPPSEREAPFWIVEGLTRDVLLKLYGTCCLGVDLPKQGRSRPGGKRSRPALIMKYYPPKMSVGPPEKIALDLLVARLAYAYEEATQRPATRFSPFSEFLVYFLSKIGKGSSNSRDPACLHRYRKSQQDD